LLNFRNFLPEQLDHELGRRARQDDGCTTQCEVNFHDHGANTVAIAKVFLRNHFAAAQTTFNATGLNNDVAFVHALNGTNQDFLAARHEFVEQHFALGIPNFLQNDLLGCHGTDAANGQ
jgi:hypothetical protein